MANVKWTLKEAIATNNYPLKGEDETIELTDDVITSVYLKVEASEGDVTKSMVKFVDLKKPVKDSFLPLDDVSKESVLNWALAEIDPRMRAAIESNLTKLAKGTAPEHRTIFNK